MIKNANKLNLNNSNLEYNTMNISSLDEGVTDTSRVISTSRKHISKKQRISMNIKKGISQRRRKRRKQEII